MGEAADLAHELYGSRANLIVGHRRFKVEQGLMLLHMESLQRVRGEHRIGTCTGATAIRLPTTAVAWVYRR